MTELLRWRDLLPTDGVQVTPRLYPHYRELFGAGPWQAEPDKVAWTDPVTGRPCLVLRNELGAVCGYVAVDPGHRLHKVPFGSLPWDLDVYGGITYSAYCDDRGPICHIPRPGEPDNVWWFGFACMSHRDLLPIVCGTMSGLLRQYDDMSYRGFGFAINQVQQLAKQLVA